MTADLGFPLDDVQQVVDLELRLLRPDVRRSAAEIDRSSVWRRTGSGGWRLYFHQGSVIPPAASPEPR